MIYTASYFFPRHHHGRLISISCGNPSNITVEQTVLTPLLVPPQGTHDYWERVKAVAKAENRKPTEEEWELFKTGYRIHIKKVLPEIKEYLEFRDRWIDETWLCWEYPGNYCHRNLAFQLLQHHFPSLAGGQDTECVIKPNTIDIGAVVKHINPDCSVGALRGKVISKLWDTAEVAWERPQAEIVNHPVHTDRYRNRLNHPERYPISLLKLFDEVNSNATSNRNYTNNSTGTSTGRSHSSGTESCY